MSTKEFRIVMTLGTVAFLFLFALIAFDVNIDLMPDQARAATYTLSPTFTYTDTVPGLLSYQGTLADANGAPIDGNVEMTFRIYTTTVGGTPLYTETHPAVVVRDGDFAVLLGELAPFPDGLFAEPNRYLSLQVGAQPEMSPRQRFASVAFALEAGHALTATQSITASHALDGVPRGTIIQYHPGFGDGDPCPTGYLLADGSNGTPNLQGKFLRGSGTFPEGGSGVAGDNANPTHNHRVQASGSTSGPSSTRDCADGSHKVARYTHTHTFGFDIYSHDSHAISPYYVVNYCIKQ